jgi:hypothetical protein
MEKTPETLWGGYMSIFSSLTVLNFVLLVMIIQRMFTVGVQSLSEILYLLITSCLTIIFAKVTYGCWKAKP